MARSRIAMIDGWEDCERCPRASSRLAVFAPQRPERTKVLVLGLAASRGSQVVGGCGAVVQHLVEVLRARLGLGPDECVGDYLVACGFGLDVSPDEVAACSARFVDGPTPSVVVFAGYRTAALASIAGLIVDRTWTPIGATPVPIVVAEEALDHSKTVNAVGQHLQRLPAPLPRPRRPRRDPLAAHADKLLTALGRHDGHGIRQPHHGGWARKEGSLNLGLVHRHLRGDIWVSPFRPVGDWPYVVVDIDRHNAIQLAHFDDVLKQVAKLLPNSLVVTSSLSGGVHVFVRLPPGTQYKHAAQWLRVFFTLKNLRWKKVSAPDGRSVKVQIVEVPAHPPRLPFGIGSSLRGSTVPLLDQLKHFLTFLRTGGTTDYDRAARHAEQHGPVSSKWGPGYHRKLQLWFGDMDLGIGGKTNPTLQPRDPWRPLVTKGLLPPYVARVAASGIPTHGSRTRWTLELIRELADVAPRDELERLMEYWVREREHQSEDIEAGIDDVVEQTKDWIDGHYRRLHGVPVNAWRAIEAEVRRSAQLVRQPPHVSFETNATVSNPFRVSTDTLVATAFFIARGFYEVGRAERPVPVREFERFAVANTGADIERTLTKNGTWLTFVSAAIPGKEARRFRLTNARYANIWPPVPGEETQFLPPVDPMPRRR